jgi:hypothetical protein
MQFFGATKAIHSRRHFSTPDLISVSGANAIILVTFSPKKLVKRKIILAQNRAIYENNNNIPFQENRQIWSPRRVSVIYDQESITT